MVNTVLPFLHRLNLISMPFPFVEKTPVKRRRLSSRGDPEETSIPTPSTSKKAAASKPEKPGPRCKRSISSVDEGEEQQPSCSKDCGQLSSGQPSTNASSLSGDDEPTTSSDVPEVAHSPKTAPPLVKEKQLPVDMVVKNVDVIFRLMNK